MTTGMITTLPLFLTTASLLPAWAANSDMVMKPPFKPKAEEPVCQTFKPEVKGQTIWYGKRKVEILQNGLIVCSQHEGMLFELSQYYVETKNRKYVDSFTPQRKKNNGHRYKKICRRTCRRQ